MTASLYDGTTLFPLEDEMVTWTCEECGESITGVAGAIGVCGYCGEWQDAPDGSGLRLMD